VITGWLDLANFRRLGDCLLWQVFLKIAEVVLIFEPLFSTEKILIIFLQIMGSAPAIFFTNPFGHPA
jgi:hypothetical protein